MPASWSQTPAARKFVPPSSTSTGRQGSSARFIKPSQPSSSPFTRTPYSSVSTKSRRDDIETTDLNSDNEEFEQVTVSQVHDHQTRLLGAKLIGSDGETPPDALMFSRTRQGSGEIVHNVSEASHNTVKRRKISHSALVTIDNEYENLHYPPPAHTTTNDDEILDSISDIQIVRSSPDIREPDLLQRGGPASSHDLEKSPSPDDSPVKELATPKLRTSRFRHPPAYLTGTQFDHDASSGQPIPSFQSRLLASTASSFRGPHPSLDFTLPDAFSPSRRRGQPEYVYGGSAETVRGWILDITTTMGSSAVSSAQAEASGGAKSDQSARPGVKIVNVDKVLLVDRDDRFILIVAATEPNIAEKWMLVNNDQRPASRHGSATRLSRVRQGTKVVIRGGNSTRWALHLDQFGGGDCKVAVLWDIVS